MEVNDLKARVLEMMESLLAEEPDYFLVYIKVKPGHIIKVFLDGDNGLPIQKCIYFNRKLYKAIEEAAWFPEGDFALEVSSPGVDEPLLLTRQYTKNIGRKVAVTLNDETIKEGFLTTVAENDIIIDFTEGKGKKAVTQQLLIPFENIKSTIVQIQF
jgi:ribosome maturation factor RimP